MFRGTINLVKISKKNHYIFDLLVDILIDDCRLEFL